MGKARLEIRKRKETGKLKRMEIQKQKQKELRFNQQREAEEAKKTLGEEKE